MSNKSSISFVEYYRSLRFGVGKFEDGIASEWSGKRIIFNQHGNGSIRIEYVDREEYDEYVEYLNRTFSERPGPYYA